MTVRELYTVSDDPATLGRELREVLGRISQRFDEQFFGLRGPINLKHTAITISSGQLVLDFNVAQSFRVVLTENIDSIRIDNPPPVDTFGEIIVEFVQDGVGSRTVTGWPSAVTFGGGGTAPTITTAAASVDAVTVRTIDGGTTYRADVRQDYQ